MSSGRVFFVGAGPGDPELLTLKAQRLIAQADLILYAGSLVNPQVLQYARAEATVFDSVGMKLADQIDLMRDAVQQGGTVVRLHTGDPSVFGATMEQMRELDRAGIDYSIVPGVSSAFAAAAALGSELTLPGGTQTVILSRAPGNTPVPDTEALRDLAAHRTSLVLFLSVGMIHRVVEELYAAGYGEDTPVAVIYRASWPDERIIRSTLAGIAGEVESAELTHQALIVVSPALIGKAAVRNSHLYSSALDTPAQEDSTAIVTLTRGGTLTGRRLHQMLPHSVLYLPDRFAGTQDDQHPGVKPYSASIRQVLQAAFRQHMSLICIAAAGIVVRELAPLLRSKHADPGVVILDEQGRYAISLLGGHKGGANDLARRVANFLGGAAVLTTSSDVQGLPSLDLLGRDEGWVLRGGRYLTDVSAALVNGEHVGVFQDAGSGNWWSDPSPANLVGYASIETLALATPKAAVVVTARNLPAGVLEKIPATIIYHPPCLAVGVGCNRSTPAGEIVRAILETLDSADLARESILCIATIEYKAKETGLLEACRLHTWPLRVFSKEHIARFENLANPSRQAYRALGVWGVAEPAAMLAAGVENLLVEKQKFANVTVAVAIKRTEKS